MGESWNIPLKLSVNEIRVWVGQNLINGITLQFGVHSMLIVFISLLFLHGGHCAGLGRQNTRV